MKAMVFGSTGWIGLEFCKRLIENDVSVIKFPSRGFDGKGYTFNELEFIIRKISPGVVINCSAYTGNPNIDSCETNKDKAIISNVIFVKMLGEACEQNRIALGHISSGCIYNGYEKEFTEEDPPNFCFGNVSPCGFYNGTKAMAEDALKNINRKWIWRIRLPFNEINHPKNYLTKILSYNTLLDMKNSISHKGDFIGACIEMILKYKPYGIYNITNPGFITTREITDIFKFKLNLKTKFNFFDNIEEFNKIVSVPRANCVLNTDKLASIGIKIRPVRKAVEDSIYNWKW